MRDDGNGFYTLDFVTRNTPVGKYTFLVSFTRPNYETRTAYIEVNVQLKVIAFELVGFVEGGVVKKPQGESILIAIDLKDVAAGNVALSGAVVELFFDGAWRNMTADNATAGRYTYTIDTSSGFDTLFAPKDFLAKIRVTLGNYTIGQAEIAFTIVVSQPEYLGIPTIYWIIAMVAIGAVVSIFVSMKLIQRARIPETIKDIDRTFKDIKNSRTLQDIKIAPSRENQYVERFEQDWQLIGETLPWGSSRKTASEKMKKISDESVESRNPEEVEK